MGEQAGKIIRTMVITLVVLALITAGIIYAVVNSSENLILGTWEAKAADGTSVSCLFTDEYENPSTKETLYYLTVKNADGSEEKEKGTYNISNGSVITFRPVDESIKDSATASFTISKEKLTCQYTRDFEEKEVVFTKTADYEKKDK